MTDPTTTIELAIPTSVAHKLSESFEGTLADAALTALKLYHGIGAEARATLQTLCEQQHTTPAKALRMALDHFHKDTARLRLKANTAGRPVVNHDRDLEIYARAKAGFTQAAIAAEFDISLVRVGQIVARQRALRNEPPRIKQKLPVPRYNLALEVDQGATIPGVAAKYNMTVDEAHALYTRYHANLPASPTKLDQINAARLADQQLTGQAPTPAPEVLTLKESTTAAPDTPTPTPTPTQPRKLAVIPPSMKNPELFRKPEDRPQPVPVDQLNMDIFRDDLTLDEAIGLLDEPKGE